MIAVGSGKNVPFCNNCVHGLPFRTDDLLTNGQTRRDRDSNARLHRGMRYGKKLRCEENVKAIVSWSILSLHACV